MMSGGQGDATAHVHAVYQLSLMRIFSLHAMQIAFQSSLPRLSYIIHSRSNVQLSGILTKQKYGIPW